MEKSWTKQDCSHYQRSFTDLFRKRIDLAQIRETELCTCYLLLFIFETSKNWYLFLLNLEKATRIKILKNSNEMQGIKPTICWFLQMWHKTLNKDKLWCQRGFFFNITYSNRLSWTASIVQFYVCEPQEPTLWFERWSFSGASLNVVLCTKLRVWSIDAVTSSTTAVWATHPGAHC